jgi:hypothetical protein
MFPTDSPARVLRWRKARASASDGACVEVASAGGLVAVQDSKNPGGSRLYYSARSWREFTARIRQR